MREAGRTQKEVAQAFNRTPRTIRYWTKREIGAVAAAVVERIQLAGGTVEEIAERLRRWKFAKGWSGTIHTLFDDGTGKAFTKFPLSDRSSPGSGPKPPRSGPKPPRSGQAQRRRGDLRTLTAAPGPDPADLAATQRLSASFFRPALGRVGGIRALNRPRQSSGARPARRSRPTSTRSRRSGPVARPLR